MSTPKIGWYHDSAYKDPVSDSHPLFVICFEQMQENYYIRNESDIDIFKIRFINESNAPLKIECDRTHLLVGQTAKVTFTVEGLTDKMVIENPLITGNIKLNGAWDPLGRIYLKDGKVYFKNKEQAKSSSSKEALNVK